MIELTKKGKVVAAGLVTIGILLLWLIASSSMMPSGYKPGTTQGYYSVDSQRGDNLINTQADLLVVDANTDSSHYLQGFYVTKAVWSTDPSMYYDATRPILVYSTPDDAAIAYCKGLIGNVYGPIYMMQGGYEGWYAWIHRNDGG